MNFLLILLRSWGLLGLIYLPLGGHGWFAARVVIVTFLAVTWRDGKD